MASERTLAWLDRLIWTLVYAGLLAAALGLAMWPLDRVADWSLLGVGVTAAGAGFVLIWLRARLTPPSGGPSRTPATKDNT